MAPIVDRLAGEYDGTVDFELYDVDKSEEGQALMQRYGAQYVPTFVFVNSDGSVAGQLIGEVDESALREQLDALR